MITQSQQAVLNALRFRKPAGSFAWWLVTSGYFGLYLIIRIALALSKGKDRFAQLSVPLLACLTLVLFYLLFSTAFHAPPPSADVGFEQSQREFRVAMWLVLSIVSVAAVVCARLAYLIRQIQSSAQLAPSCSPLTAFCLSFIGFYGGLYVQKHVNSMLTNVRQDGDRPDAAR